MCMWNGKTHNLYKPRADRRGTSFRIGRDGDRASNACKSTSRKATWGFYEDLQGPGRRDMVADSG